MNHGELFSFVVAAIALLGSPGPAIAALLGVGRTSGWNGGLPFFGGLQVGLASAAGITIIGLFATLSAFPNALFTMSLVATLYLLFLAYKIATSPVGQDQSGAPNSPTAFAGFFLGVTNPKAYLAFASLFASFQIFELSFVMDSVAKWTGVVVVMIVVDIIWLWIGVRLGQLSLSNSAERIMNYALATAIVLAAGLALV
jgi:threonine/homoserine/homoserine lactone efflux protein